MSLIPTIAANLHTQDNRMTANPIFLVQQKERVFCDEDGSTSYYWVDEDWSEVEDAETIERLEEAEESHPFDAELAAHEKQHFRDEYVFVQPFFTEVGAQAYIKANGHNLNEPRIYVECGYRNAEWEAVRAFLKAQVEAPKP